MGLKATFLILILLLVWKTAPLPDEDFSSDLDSNEWTEWTDWSECSRSCDGGVSRQIRKCLSSKCEGSAIEYKICNMESCPPDGADFRESQCASYNEFGETEKIWKPYYHPEEPCALYCVDQNNNIELLAARVQDGTRCRPGSLEMCIDGLCQPVGCDLKIGSLKTIDSCGVCGGSGNTCSQVLYQWNENTNTSCSVKCGGGYKVSQPVCQNLVTNEIVDQQLCDISQMPQVRLMECNAGSCPPRWEAAEWSACSQSCGSGIKRRKVFCIQEQNNTKTHVFNPLCKAPKPRMQESCNMQPCPPEWIAGQWSACSTNCGQGTQTRTVTCNKNPAESLQCDPTKRPPTEQKCIGNSCQDKYFALYDEEPKSSAMYYKGSNFHVAEKPISKQTITSEPIFVPEDWGPCSVTCGEGVRRRKVICKAHLDYTGVTRKFTDDTCSGKKPEEEEPCKVKPCADASWENTPMREEFGDDNRESSPKVAPGLFGRKYTWVKMGFTPCTKTCLGGVQELIVNCVRDDNKVVSPYLCDSKTQPPVITQTCNDHPCPPRWNVSEYSPCAKSCGMGIRTREVTCIHEVTMSNTAMVPNTMCEPQSQPTDRELCNIVDCPTEWFVSNWTKCSKVCGGGVKTREVRCHQITAQNHDVSHPDHVCKGPKPSTSRPCNSRSCNSNRKSSTEIVRSADHPVYDPSDPVNRDHPVMLSVGQQASLYEGSRVHIRCPTENFPKEKIVWLRGDTKVHSKGRYRINKKGILRIKALSSADNTTFTCKAGQSSGSLTIMVKPAPGKFPPNSEESFKYSNQHDPADPAITMGYSGHRNNENYEDFSHEGPQDQNKRYNSYLKDKASSTQSYPSPMGATTEDALTGSQGIKQEVGPDFLAPSASSASRLTPSFFGILFSLKESENVRNERMLTEDPDELLDNKDNGTLADNIFGAPVLLGKGDKSSIKFEWFVGEWSDCSPHCGGTGFQIRAAQCLVKMDNVTQNVESNLCEDAGLPLPLTIQKCETDACPHWIVHEWQDCNTSRCFAWNTAMQKRDVICQSANGTLVPDAYCESSEKPTTKQECYNDLCKGVWKVGEWTRCYASCDGEGLKYRILQCVWYGTKKPAGTACRDQPRPAVMKSCKKPCSADQCKDLSKYCPNVKILHMCKTPRYQAKCCQSCKEEI